MVKKKLKINQETPNIGYCKNWLSDRKGIQTVKYLTPAISKVLWSLEILREPNWPNLE